VRFISRHGTSTLASVHVAQLADGSHIECVESVQPPVPLSEKWVHIISTLKGCPISCAICDAGGHYGGKLTCDELVGQVDHLIATRFPDGRPRTRRLKVQFARMGDPALNPAVLPALEVLAHRFGEVLFPAISTIAPAGCDAFLEALLSLKERHFGPRFQMQFSLHTTDEGRRCELVPARTWSYARMAEYGCRFHGIGERKVTLNFAPPAGYPMDARALGQVFSPAHFAVKLTPVNPTGKAMGGGYQGAVDPADPEACRQLARGFEDAGFDTILSIGELEENRIGSNCGMYVSRMKGAREAVC
jgi:23S rRNA (adenine2503-C2)-methyltransferase